MCGIQNKMLYPAPDFPVAAAPSGFQERLLELASGDRAVLWLQTENDQKTALLYLHGNGENLGTLAASGLLGELAGIGRAAALDYPGYGRSTGTPSEAGNVEAALTAVRELRQDTRNKAGVVLWGWSLGAGVAAAVAARAPEDVAALILWSPWSSLDSVARTHFPGWLVTLLRKESYDSDRALRGATIPVLIVHGEMDPLIPVSEARRLAAVTPSARLVILPGVGHNDLPGNPLAWKAARVFLRELQR